VPHTQIGGQCRLVLGHEHHPNAGRERCDIAPSIRRHYSRTLKESKLTSVDATDASLDVAEDAEVGATSARCALPENRCRIARGRAMGRIRLPPDGVFQVGWIVEASHARRVSDTNEALRGVCPPSIRCQPSSGMIQDEQMD
jgi:hypothetical protein